MGNIVVKAENLGKKYKIGAVVDRSPTLRDAIVRAAKRPGEILRGRIASEDGNYLGAAECIL